MKLKLIPAWRREAQRLWSIRLGLLWAALIALGGAFGALQGVLSYQAFITLSVFIQVVIAWARLTKQKDVPE